MRVVARCHRWRHKQNRAAHLTADELTWAHNKLVRILQTIHFSNEIPKGSAQGHWRETPTPKFLHRQGGDITSRGTTQ